MSKLTDLFGVLNIMQYNFKIIHWKACGTQFDTIHEVANQLASATYNYIDDVAEMALMLSLPILPLKAFGEVDSENILILDVKKNYEGQEAFKCIKECLQTIVDIVIETCDDDVLGETEYAGIRADLESILAYYTKELLYLNKRRLIKE